MASGFLQADVSSTVTLGSTNSGAGAPSPHPNGSYTNDFAKITLTTHEASGMIIGLPTSGVRWSHFELIIKDSDAGAGGSSAHESQTDHECKVFFTWDTDGNDICAGPSSSAEMIAGRNNTDTYAVVIDMDMVPTRPPDGVANIVYAHVATINFEDNTPELLRARLYWHDLTKG